MARPRKPARASATSKPQPPPLPSPALFTTVSAAVLVVAIGVVYGRALNSPFVFDDSVSVVENSSIRHLWPLVRDDIYRGPLNPPRDLPTSGRPLVNLSFAVNYGLTQLNPWSYHAVNMFLHFCSAMLLAAIVRRTLLLPCFGARFDRAAVPLGLAAALVWAVHPLNTEAVAYVTQRTELMAGFFYLATLYASMRFWAAGAGGSQTRWLAAAFVACACGMACKEVMVTAPAFVLLYCWVFVADSTRAVFRTSWKLCAVLGSTWLVLLYLNYDAPRSQSAGFHLDAPAYSWWFTQAKVIWIYLKLAVWPWPLSIHYEIEYFDSFSPASPWVLATAALAIVSVALVLWRSAIGFALATTFLILSPTLVVPIITEVAAERRMYLPLAALTAVAVCCSYCCLEWICNHVSRRSRADLPLSYTLAGGLLLAAACGWVSIQRLNVYQDEADLWRDALVSFPNDAVAHNGLGRALLERRDFPGAVEHLQFAVQLAPTFPDAQSNLGHALFKIGRSQDALVHLQTALRLKPDHVNAHVNVGGVLSATGHPEEAIAEFLAALAMRPDLAIAHYNLANAYAKTGQKSQAIEHYRQAIAIDPSTAEASQNLSNVLHDLGRTDEAIQCLEENLRLKPNEPNTHFNLAVALTEQNRLPEAIEHFREAVRLQPGNLNARWQLTLTYAQAGNRAAAIDYAQKSIEAARAAGEATAANQIQQWLDQYRAAGGN